MHLIQRTASSANQAQGYHDSILPLSKVGIAVVTTDIVFVVLVTLWMALRLYSRRIVGIGLMVEDYLHICALISFYGLALVSILMVLLGGFGHHVIELEKSRMMLCLKLGFSSQILYTAALGFVKISICTMLARIFSRPSFKLMARILIGLSCCWMAMTVLIGFLICHPVQVNWDPLLTGRKCGNPNIAFAVAGIMDVTTDFFVLLVPIPTVLKLNLPRASKVGLIFIFCMGILTMVVGSVRVAVLLDVNFIDFTYSGKTLHILSVSEAAVAIMVSSSPMLRPVLNRVPYGSIFSTNRRSGDDGESRDRFGRLNTHNRGIFSNSLQKNSQELSPMRDIDINSTPVDRDIQNVTKFDADQRSPDDVDDGEETRYTTEDNESTKAIV